MSLKHIATIVLIVLACRTVHADDTTRLPAPLSPEKGLEQIGCSLEFTGPMQVPEHTYRVLWFGVRDNCREALDALLAADAGVEERLLALARGAKGLDPLHVRSVLVLVLRGIPQVLPVVYEMLRDADARVRFCGTLALFDAGSIPAIRSALDPHTLMECYRKENNDEVREALAQLFGTIKLTEATADLRAGLSRSRTEVYGEVWALGRLRDSDAVPDLIRVIGAVPSPTYDVLAKIGTPESISWLCDHVDDFQAAEALIGVRGEKAQQAMRAHLARLKEDAKRGGNLEWDIARVEISLAECGEADPRETLLRMAEDTDLPDGRRAEALNSLRRYDCSDSLERILALLQEDLGTGHGPRREGLAEACVKGLAASRDPKVTHALMQLGTDENLDDARFSTYANEMRDALNERIGTHYFTWKFLHWHLALALAAERGK